ncbi:hypothetical protein [Salinibacter altiplanensis]|uniref:hypothetical protein n=1 Tax=Salinibacter altiplanensis TaxID=1803181 RepID=UPI000C9F19FC|nr:hypothetical protein [Salinibacter altiplanensis]
MAAPETEIVGVNLLTKANGTLIGGQTDLTLDKTLNLQEVEDKNAGFFGKSIPGFEESSITADNAYTGDGGEHILGEDDNVEAQLTSQDGSATEVVQGLQELTCTLESELVEVQTFQSSGAKEYRVAGQSLDLSLSGQYFDPAATDGAGHDLILSAEEADEYLSLSLTFGALTISGDIRPEDWSLSAPAGNDTATFDSTFRHEGVINHNGTVDGGLDAVIDAWFNRNTVAALLEYQEVGTAVSGATKYEGDGFVSSLELSGTQGEPLDLNYELQVTGGLTRALQA